MERYFKKKSSSPEMSIDTQESASGTGCRRTIQSSSVQPEPARLDYRTRLSQFADCIKLFLGEGLGLPYCGLGWEEGRREQYFIAIVQLLDSGKHPNGVLLRDAAEGLPIANAETQNWLVRASATETTKAIIQDMEGDLFGVHFAGFYDIQCRELMAVVLRYVDKEGIVKERFIGVFKMTDFSDSSYKEALDSFLSEHGLESSRIRGQSYDGVSYSRRECKGLKNSIMGENGSAYHTHCFTRQLHTTLIAAVGKHLWLTCCGEAVSDILNLVGAPCQPHDELEKKEKEAALIVKALTNREPSAEELYRISSRIRSNRWKFSYEMLQKLVDVFFSVTEVLDIVQCEGSTSKERVKACLLLSSLCSFYFVFGLFFAKSVLGITNELSLALENTDQDFANVVKLAEVCRQQLQIMRAEGWESFLAELSSFCQNHDILVPNMDDNYRFSRDPVVTNLIEYRDRTFYKAIDSQLEVLSDLFGEVNMELLLSAASLSPSNSFHHFDKQKLLRLAQFYPKEFSTSELLVLAHQLDEYILDMRSDERFSKLNSLADLSRMLVETKKHIIYPLVYLLLKLALLLPFTAPLEERSASKMKLVEEKLSEYVCDTFMNDCLVTYVETDVLHGIANDKIVNCFETLKPCN